MAVIRDEKGRIVSGSVLNPYGRTGAPSSKYLQAIGAALPPESVEPLLEEAVKYARGARSWKGILAILTFCLDYRVGRPVQRSVTANTDVSKLITLLNGDMSGIEELFADALADAKGATIDGEASSEE